MTVKKILKYFTNEFFRRKQREDNIKPEHPCPFFGFVKTPLGTFEGRVGYNHCGLSPEYSDSCVMLDQGLEPNWEVCRKKFIKGRTDRIPKSFKKENLFFKRDDWNGKDIEGKKWINVCLK
ncbi:MAG: hypothetical protein ACTSVO_02785 [Candidatus Heimdallarchaeaceae archaeon]